MATTSTEGRHRPPRVTTTTDGGGLVAGGAFGGRPRLLRRRLHDHPTYRDVVVRVRAQLPARSRARGGEHDAANRALHRLRDASRRGAEAAVAALRAFLRGGARRPSAACRVSSPTSAASRRSSPSPSPSPSTLVATGAAGVTLAGYILHELSVPALREGPARGEGLARLLQRPPRVGDGALLRALRDDGDPALRQAPPRVPAPSSPCPRARSSCASPVRSISRPRRLSRPTRGPSAVTSTDFLILCVLTLNPALARTASAALTSSATSGALRSQRPGLLPSLLATTRTDTAPFASCVGSVSVASSWSGRKEIFSSDALASFSDSCGT